MDMKKTLLGSQAGQGGQGEAAELQSDGVSSQANSVAKLGCESVQSDATEL